MAYEKTVLVIEDTKPLNKILCFDLKQAGFKTESAFNGKEGYEKAIEIKPDLILLDVNMPLMNGFEVCWKVKANLHIKDVPIIMLTGRSEDSDFREAKDSAANAYILKPYKQEILIERVKELLYIKD
ncbi:MAG: response regulator [Candidatus Aureabacteria bacterium]|nr:response regulator [Candidatus Auribacterota bacterium]